MNELIIAAIAAGLGSVITVIGKGDETYQIVNGEYVYYKSDVKVAEELTKNTVNV